MSLRALVACALLLHGSAAFGGEPDFEFEQVADTSTVAPGAVSDFAHFGPPAIDGEHVAFTAQAAGVGVFAWSGGALRAIALAGDGVPEAADGFLSFGAVSIQGDAIAVQARSERFRREGVYRTTAQGIERVVDAASEPPGSASAYLTFDGVWLDGDALVFAAAAAEPEPVEGIYRVRGGQVERLVDEGSPWQRRAASLLVLREPVADRGRVFFHGVAREHAGLFEHRGGELRVVISTHDPIPGGGEPFRDFEYLSARNGGLAFAGRGEERSGVYRAGDELRVIADTDTSLPGESTRFTGFAGVAVDGERVAFHGRGAELDEGIFLHSNGRTRTVVRRDDRLEGRRVSAVQLGAQGLSGERVAFRAVFDDGSEGLFVATPQD